MPNGIRGVPFSPKVHPLKTEVSCEQDFVIWRNAENRAVVTNAGNHGAVSIFAQPEFSGLSPDVRNQLSFGKGQGEEIICVGGTECQLRV